MENKMMIKSQSSVKNYWKTSHDAMPFVEQENQDLDENNQNPEPQYTNYSMDENKLPLQVKVRRSLAPMCSIAHKAYAMVSDPSGTALIINNQEFEEESRRRLGAEVDGNNLQNLFSQLGFNVILRKDLSYINMIKEIRSFSHLSSHETADMSIICILTHGDDGILESTDGAFVKKEWVLEQFNNENCPALQGKPKFFILQSCSGVQKDYGVVQQERITSTDALAMNENAENSLVSKSVTWEDILIANATVPGYVSYRNHNWGSWFIECICQVFMQQAADTDIEEMLKSVAIRLSEYESEFGTKQSFEWANRNFYKKLYFNPGWTWDQHAWKPLQKDDNCTFFPVTKKNDQPEDEIKCSSVVNCDGNANNKDDDDVKYILEASEEVSSVKSSYTPKANVEQIEKLNDKLSKLRNENKLLKRLTYVSAVLVIAILSIAILQINNQLKHIQNFLNFTDV